jgi:hypothetical protein
LAQVALVRPEVKLTAETARPPRLSTPQTVAAVVEVSTTVKTAVLAAALLQMSLAVLVYLARATQAVKGWLLERAQAAAVVLAVSVAIAPAQTQAAQAAQRQQTITQVAPFRIRAVVVVVEIPQAARQELTQVTAAATQQDQRQPLTEAVAAVAAVTVTAVAQAAQVK